MKSLPAFLTIILLAAPLIFMVQRDEESEKDEFSLWKDEFGVVFTSLEDYYRKIIFMDNIKKFSEHNNDSRHKYKLGKGPFTALSKAEFQNSYLELKKIDMESFSQQDLKIPTVNQNIDWVANGKVSPVKFMGNCPADWAFTAVASVQSLALFKNQSIIFSQQQMIDCTSTYGNLACNDGAAFQALEYVRDHGIETQAKYPYIEKRQKCQTNGGAFKITSWQHVKGCHAISTAILERPLAVMVNAVYWQHYHSGIFTECQNQSQPNYESFLVGLTVDYWKIKNAWGPKWGEDGYIRLALNNPCGICYLRSVWAA